MQSSASRQTVDTLHTVETPEGALLQFAVAGPVVRGLAWLVDVCFRLIILLGLFISLADLSSGENGYVVAGFWMITQFLLAWMYTTLFEASTGTTPGKRLFRLWVIHDNGTPVTASGALIRNFLRAIDGLPFLNMAGLCCMLIDSRFRRIGDLAAGTLVIYRDKPPADVAFEHSHSVAPPLWLNRDERQAIVDYAERCATLSPQRQQELAESLRHLMDTDVDAVDTLKSWAQWILGGQAHAQSTGV